MWRETILLAGLGLPACRTTSAETPKTGENMTRKVPVAEFWSRLAEARTAPDTSYAFFLGSGCSVSSGIPDAARLVKDRWLPRLRDLRAPVASNLEDWARKDLPAYDSQDPAGSFGEVAKELFLTDEDTQREIETLCENKFPGFGYAVLAGLSAKNPGRFNVILTTNFDDLMADAFYLFTNQRPLVIADESLAGFIRPTRTRPLVVKLHGDQRLAPSVKDIDTRELAKRMRQKVAQLLEDRGLVFVGYGGRDESIIECLHFLDSSTPRHGVFWVGPSDPSGLPIGEWLGARKTFWVESSDFDELMVRAWKAMGLEHPDERRFDQVYAKYMDDFNNLTRRLDKELPSAPEAGDLRTAVRSAKSALPGPWHFLLGAGVLANADADSAEARYVEGLRIYPAFAPLLGNYAVFLQTVRKDPDRAEEYHKRAIEADPAPANSLANYAVFLQRVRKDPDRAEEYYRRAIEADPADVTSLGKYAGLLLALGRPNGLPTLALALDLVSRAGPQAGAVECWFYAFVHRTDEEKPPALSNLKRLLMEGVRSPRWDLSPHVEAARSAGNPDLPWVELLARVIGEDAAIDALDAWEEWRQTGDAEPEAAVASAGAATV